MRTLKADMMVDVIELFDDHTKVMGGWVDGLVKLDDEERKAQISVVWPTLSDNAKGEFKAMLIEAKKRESGASA